MNIIQEFIEDLEEIHPKILESDHVEDEYLETRLEMAADTIYDVLQDENVTEEYRMDMRHAVLNADYEEAYDLLDEYKWRT